MTRIVAGAAGGRRLQVPPKGTRPTSDRVREALFSSLETFLDLDGAHVLDLYAGSGALGFEALSRGAATATLVESDRRAADVLRANAASLRLPGATVLHRPAEVVVAAPPERPCDLVLADPPYAVTDEQLNRVLADLVANGWTAPGTLLVVERASRSPEPVWPSPLEPLRGKRYGDTALHWSEHPQARG
ncbi:16S rRNA (guanine(966)-N(2))-methyltransferase RsmD [Actinosynnema pretiosum subsp. pretiosum]|uniref:Methyltransferase n=2 Tax=Actinosynnema TaxID=40566 RepID=C6WF02_ACTMD|nr:16S rRNA (guanine(966)-N(2))-methyltransferase RsmD [Actinosynnema mirum]ACU39777.1 methyltransferase [Actinosynnema mirum DSM 43827]AXX33287.1 16S rRNA (guanine(966)-N(2))-methyltransferase [Actinosynnema pretiosum subsp. pretiosum]QUF02885.1 16S rRNA (guanine(966)-N(2))-methyltransferase RsmD [Actinosynnema pretiosum subsp. pretiosum]